MPKSVDDSNGADLLSQLRAERVDSGDGRVYLIVVRATDAAANSGSPSGQFLFGFGSRGGGARRSFLLMSGQYCFKRFPANFQPRSAE